MSILVDGQINGRRAAGSPVRSRHLRLVDDGQRPCAQVRYVPTRAGLPRQPKRPLAGASYSVVRSAASGRAVVRPTAAGGELRLTDRGLAVMMAGFALAVVLGSWVIVSQYLALVPGLT